MKRKQHDERKRFMVYLPPEVMEKLREAAKTNYRSINGELRYILERHFAVESKPVDWLQPKSEQAEPAGQAPEHADEAA
jgi:hypothetical protein